MSPRASACCKPQGPERSGGRAERRFRQVPHSLGAVASSSPAQARSSSGAPRRTTLKLEDLLLSSERPIAKRKGLIGEVQRTFEAVTKLPKKQPLKVLEMVQALAEHYKRKAS